MSEASEQNKTEAATPFKLKRAREKGQIARGVDLGFFSSLAAFALFMSFMGAELLESFARAMTRVFARAGSALEPWTAARAALKDFWPALAPMLWLAGTIVAVVLVFEIIQVRGLSFSTAPLKPDFNRLNPGKGLKRLFSMRRKRWFQATGLVGLR
jgi:flagellar biosynthetic protein FlhB